MARIAALALVLALGLNAVTAQNSPGADLGRSGGLIAWGRPTNCDSCCWRSLHCTALSL